MKYKFRQYGKVTIILFINKGQKIDGIKITMKGKWWISENFLQAKTLIFGYMVLCACVDTSFSIVGENGPYPINLTQQTPLLLW